MPNAQLNGGQYFSAVFPLYCNVASAGTKTINYTAVDDVFLISVNGNNFVSKPNSIELNQGINRVVIYYRNAAWSSAYLHFSVSGVSQWYHPANLASCEGKTLKNCISAVSTINGLSSGINGLFYYHGFYGQGVVGIGMPRTPLSYFWPSGSSELFSNFLTPGGFSKFANAASQFNFWSDLRESFVRPGGSIEWPTISFTETPPVLIIDQFFKTKLGIGFYSPSQIEYSGGPATFSATNLPSWASIGSDGKLAGIPDQVGSTEITITASGSVGSDTKTATLWVGVGDQPKIKPNQIFTGSVGRAWVYPETDADVSFLVYESGVTLSAAGLPSWAAFDPLNFSITGTPTEAGDTTITLTATGQDGSDTETAIISIVPSAPVIATSQTLSGTVGTAFSRTPSSTGSITTWAATGLPAWASINSATGAITGTPTAAASTTISLTATGPGGSDTESATISIAAATPAPVITPSQTLTGTVGTAFSRTPASTGSVTTWAATGLPAWASINSSTGQITGTPTTAATTTISLTATGPGGSDTESATITIGNAGATAPTMQLNPQQNFTATLGVAFNQTPAIVSGTATSWYAIGLPSWASINATTGAITGTPTFTSVASATVTAQDSSGFNSSATITLTVVSWNTLEIFVDPKGRKILSRANTRSPLQKLFLKRDDLTNFRIVFVSDEQPFALPADYAVSVGIKSSYSDPDFIAFSNAPNGTLDLTNAEVQSLFDGEPAAVEAIFEVKWEDNTSASRTASLPVTIQNTVLRGNNSEPPPPPVPEVAPGYLAADAETQAAATSAAVKALSLPRAIVNAGTYSLTAQPATRRISIAYPASLGSIQKISYAGYDVTDTFAVATVAVSTQDYGTVNYLVHTYIAAVPFGAEAQYHFTI